MYVRMYKYRIATSHRRAWKKIADAADKIYRKHGATRSLRLAEAKGADLLIYEIAFYNSGAAYERTVRGVDNEPAIPLLFRNFQKLLKSKVAQYELRTL